MATDHPQTTDIGRETAAEMNRRVISAWIRARRLILEGEPALPPDFTAITREVISNDR